MSERMELVNQGGRVPSYRLYIRNFVSNEYQGRF